LTPPFFNLIVQPSVASLHYHMKWQGRNNFLATDVGYAICDVRPDIFSNI
jgi:hypothetical protein